MIRYGAMAILFLALPRLISPQTTEPAERILSISGDANSFTLHTKTGSNAANSGDVRILVTNLDTGLPLPLIVRPRESVPNKERQRKVDGLSTETWYGILFQSPTLWPVYHLYNERRIFRTFSKGKNGAAEAQVGLNVSLRIVDKDVLRLFATAQRIHLDLFDVHLQITLFCDRIHANNSLGHLKLTKDVPEYFASFPLKYTQKTFGSPETEDLAAILVPKSCHRACWDIWLNSIKVDASYFLRKNCSEVPADTIKIPVRKVKHFFVRDSSATVETELSPINETELNSSVTITVFNLSGTAGNPNDAISKQFKPSENRFIETNLVPDVYYGLRYVYDVSHAVKYVYKENFAFKAGGDANNRSNTSAIEHDDILRNITYLKDKLLLTFARPESLRPHQVKTRVHPFCDQAGQFVVMSNEEITGYITLEMSDSIHDTLAMMAAAKVNLEDEMLEEHCRKICWEHEIVEKTEGGSFNVNETFHMEKTCAAMADILSAIENGGNKFLVLRNSSTNFSLWSLLTGWFLGIVMAWKQIHIGFK